MTNQHTLRSRMYSPDIKFANGLGPTRPTNALAMRGARPKKKSLAVSTAQAMAPRRQAPTDGR
jgi:hypothetical protein